MSAQRSLPDPFFSLLSSSPRKKLKVTLGRVRRQAQSYTTTMAFVLSPFLCPSSDTGQQ